MNEHSAWRRALCALPFALRFLSMRWVSGARATAKRLLPQARSPSILLPLPVLRQSSAQALVSRRGAKAVPPLPRLGFPLWIPPSEAPPPEKVSPKGETHPSPPLRVRLRWSLFRGRMALSTDPGEPFASLRVTAFAFPSARHSRLSPKRGLPSEKDRDTVVVASCFRYRFSTKPCLSAQSHSLL